MFTIILEWRRRYKRVLSTLIHLPCFKILCDENIECNIKLSVFAFSILIIIIVPAGYFALFINNILPEL